MIPDRLTNICQVANVVKKPGGVNADLVCSGPITGKGTLEVIWTDSEHTTGTIHFSGSIQPGETPIKIEWAAVTKSTYKGPDCGAVMPKTVVIPKTKTAVKLIKQRLPLKQPNDLQMVADSRVSHGLHASLARGVLTCVSTHTFRNSAPHLSTSVQKRTL